MKKKSQNNVLQGHCFRQQLHNGYIAIFISILSFNLISRIYVRLLYCYTKDKFHISDIWFDLSNAFFNDINICCHHFVPIVVIYWTTIHTGLEFIRQTSTTRLVWRRQNRYFHPLGFIQRSFVRYRMVRFLLINFFSMTNENYFQLYSIVNIRRQLYIFFWCT